jgi:hypothetical protein
MVSTAVTPSRKWKPIYDSSPSNPDDSSVPALQASSSLDDTPSEYGTDFDLVMMESFDHDIPVLDEEQMAEILSKWMSVVQNIKQIGSAFLKIKRFIGDDVDILQTKSSVVDSHIGNLPQSAGLEDCLSVWNGITFLHQGFQDISNDLQQLQGSFVTVNNTCRNLESSTTVLEQHTISSLWSVKQEISGMVNLFQIITDEQEVISQKLQDVLSTGILPLTSPHMDEIHRLAECIMSCEAQLTHRIKQVFTWEGWRQPGHTNSM